MNWIDVEKFLRDMGIQLRCYDVLSHNHELLLNILREKLSNNVMQEIEEEYRKRGLF